ncbi:MAG: TrkA family potassium uptake protein [Ndongobacter sp.]|nr:TrkA family potassium uptake protein [Ndongobacter sp.]
MLKLPKTFAVIGCGRFGANVARTLAELGNDVLAVDASQEIVNDLSPHVTYAICADVGVEGALDSIGLSNVDCAIIGLSSDFEAAVMATALCREQKVPMIIAKARSELHGRILQRVGASKIILPERDIGIKLAHSLSSQSVYEYFELSEEHSLVESAVPKAWLGKTLGELNVRKHYGVSIIGILNEGYSNINPSPADKFREGDRILVLGSHAELMKLEEKTQ